jgi:hypothetical protein
VSAPGPYVLALRARELFADPAYQRDVDPKRVAKMAAEFDRRLVGVLEVSKRPDTRFAILDGQHRHATLLQVEGDDALLVCQVYEELTEQDEARLFHEINARRKQLNFWDRWKSRRAAGDERVLAIEQVLANHGLQVHPSVGDGNIAATQALEVIVDEIGELWLLDSVVVVLLSAFGRRREAFDGAILQGLAYVLAVYPPDELDRDRLVTQLSDLPVRQLLAKAAGMREVHRGTRPRLCAAVIVEQYNRGRGSKVAPFFSRVPERTQSHRVRQRLVTDTAAPAPTPAPPAQTRVAARPVVEPRRPAPPPPALGGVNPLTCECGHSKRLHEDGEGMCHAGCNCPGFQT